MKKKKKRKTFIDFFTIVLCETYRNAKVLLANCEHIELFFVIIDVE